MIHLDDRPDRDRYFMGIAIAVRERANCIGSRVGAIIVQEGRIISTGYNGTPSGMKNCLEGGCYRCSNRTEFPSGSGYDLCICVHAEQNALLAAARFGIAVENAALYTTMQPCFGCLKEMLQAKIHIVHFLHEWTPGESTRAQYELLAKALPGGLHRIDMLDSKAEWAVSARWKELHGQAHDCSTDETGHDAG